MGLVVDHELEMTEIRVRQLRNLVDVFVLLESNVTAGKSSFMLTENKINSEKLELEMSLSFRSVRLIYLQCYI